MKRQVVYFSVKTIKGINSSYYVNSGDRRFQGSLTSIEIIVSHLKINTNIP